MDSLPEGLFPSQSGPRLRQVPPSQWGPEHRNRPINYPILEEPEHLEAKLISFEAGGFELSVRRVDVQKRIEWGMDGVRPLRGARKPINQRSEMDKERAVRRARQKVRVLCRQIGCRYLVTFTTREESNTPEELAGRWWQFCRMVERRMGRRLQYVAVPERHPTNPNHWHLHVGIPMFLNVNVARPIWWACCGGRGMGNIDAKYIKVPHALGEGERSRRVAHYLSKYMTKELLTEHRPDKKSYWRSRFEGPQVMRTFLDARPGQWSRIVEECVRRFGCVYDPLVSRGWFMFPDGSGFWYSHIAGHPGQAEPPF